MWDKAWAWMLLFQVMFSVFVSILDFCCIVELYWDLVVVLDCELPCF